MRIIRLSLYFIIGVLISLVAVPHASATYPQITNQWKPNATGLCPAPFVYTATPELATQGIITNCLMPLYGGTYPNLQLGTCTITGSTASCSINQSPGVVFSVYSPIALTQSSGCNANATLSGSTCTCNSGYTQSGNLCVANTPVCPSAGTKVSGTFGGSGALPATLCILGCTVNVTSGASGGSPKTFEVYGMQSAGTSCTVGSGVATAEPSEAPAPPTPCQTGTCSGTVNGVQMCLKCSNSENKASNTNVTNNADGSQTSKLTVTSQKINPDGTVTTTTSTYTTQYPAGGGSPTTAVTSESKTDDQRSFCKENPELAMCKDSSFGGSCGAFQCTGDGIQCAIAREQHNRNCEMFVTTTTLSTLGTAVAGGSDPSASSLPQHSSQLVTVPVGAISESTFLTGGTLSDQTFDLWGGKTLVIPWSKWNVVLGYMGLIVLGFASVAAYRIVGIK